MSEICGMTTASFPFDPQFNNPNDLGPCRLSPNHEGDHESAQSLEGKIIGFVKWREKSSGLELTSISSGANPPKLSDLNITPEDVPEEFDKTWTREANRVRALDFAVRAIPHLDNVWHNKEGVLKVADYFNDWLNKPLGDKI